MKTIKGLILGSAAGLLAMTGAQAADLPLKAKAVEYVKVCSIYGAGFYYIPGTDTCVKIGGFILAETDLNASTWEGSPNWNGNSGQGNRLANKIGTVSRFDLEVDTRTATEYGTVRTYGQAIFNTSTGADAGGTAFVQLLNAYVQFAGFTIGRATSPFEAPWSAYPGNITDYLVGGPGTITGVNQLTYTAQFGNGVSATVSLEDPSLYYQTSITNVNGALAPLSVAGAATGVYGTNIIGGVAAPDIIGQVQVNQAWGLWQAAVAAHDNHTSYYDGATSISGHPSDVWGFAVETSLSIKNIPTGPGDTINIDAAYANGASRYVFSSLIPTGFAMYGSSAAGLQGSVAFAGVTDSVVSNGTSQQLTTTYGFRGAYSHNWNAHWVSQLFGAWATERYSSGGASLICGTAAAPSVLAAAMSGGVAGCNPNFSIGQVGINTTWTPVKNLAFVAEAMWVNLHQNNSGTIVLPAIGSNPAGTYQFKDQNTVEVALRAIRIF